MRHVRQERSRSATTPVPGFTAPSLDRGPGCCTMLWMTGVLRWRGATARIHAELALIGIDIPGPVFSGHDSSFRTAARLPPAEVAKRQAASCMQCATSPHPVGEKRRRKHKAHVSRPGNGRAPRSKEHSTPSADDREPHDRRHTHRTRHSAACGPADGIPQRAQELSPVGELGASSERLTAGGLHEGYVWVVAEAA